MQGLNRGMAAAHPVQTSADPNGQRRRQTRSTARSQIMGRLDRSHRGRQAAVRAVGATAADAQAGWKGRALWTTCSTRMMFHIKGGKENRPKVVKFQLRLDPLAW